MFLTDKRHSRGLGDGCVANHSVHNFQSVQAVPHVRRTSRGEARSIARPAALAATFALAVIACVVLSREGKGATHFEFELESHMSVEKARDTLTAHGSSLSSRVKQVTTAVGHILAQPPRSSHKNVLSIVQGCVPSKRWTLLNFLIVSASCHDNLID